MTLRPVSHLFIVFSASLALLIGSESRAVNPAQTLSEYKHFAWKIGDVGLSGRPFAVAQSADGYIWVGTSAGLFRFDGVRFSAWEPASDHRFTNAVNGLFRARDGALWISGSFKGLIRLNGHAAEVFGEESTVWTSHVTQDEDGVIWFVARDQEHDQFQLCKLDANSRTQCLYSTTNIIFSPCSHAGAIWFGIATALVRFKNGEAKVYPIEGLEPSAGQQGVTAVVADGEGGLFVGMEKRGPGLGLERLVNDKLVPVNITGLDASQLKVLSLHRDSYGALWVGTEDDGIYRIFKNHAEHFGVHDGLSGNAIWYTIEDHEGSVWVETLDGLDRFSDRPVVTVKDEGGFHPETVDGVAVSRDGTLWVSGDDTLLTLASGAREFRPAIRAPIHGQVTSVFEDHAGRMWIGLDNTLNRLEGDRLKSVNGPDGSPMGMIMSIAEDGDANLWAVSRGPPRQNLKIDTATLKVTFLQDLPPASRVAADTTGGIYLAALNGDIFHIARNGERTHALPPDGQTGRISHLTAGENGLLLASTPFGLMTVVDGRSQALNSQNGLPCDQVYDTVLDQDANIWLLMQCGITRILKDEFSKWLHNPSTVVSIINFDEEDGAIPINSAFGGSARTPDGRLWFANPIFLQRVDPGALMRPTIAPPVHIEKLIADRIQYPLGNRITLPRLTHDIEIAYAGLSFIAPDRVQFRYKLEGFDRDWQHVEGRRQAVYTALPPGAYRFRVDAHDRHSELNGRHASIDFYVQPAFYETVEFKVLCVLLVFGVIWMAMQLRIRQVAAQVRLRESVQHAERERIARQLHDTFLQSVQGLLLRFASVAKKVPPELSARGILEDLLRRSDTVIAEARGSIQDLREYEKRSLDLSQEISVLAKRILIDGQFAVTVLPRGIPFELTSDVFENVLLIAQEAMLNVAKHASAQNMEVEIDYLQSDLRLSVRDDGAGMEDILVRKGREGHWGLVGMRERASAIHGKLRILSRPGVGTEIELIVPRSFASVRRLPSRTRRLWSATLGKLAHLRNVRGPKTGLG